MLEAAKENYEIAKKYVNVDDRLIDGIMETIKAEDNE